MLLPFGPRILKIIQTQNARSLESPPAPAPAASYTSSASSSAVIDPSQNKTKQFWMASNNSIAEKHRWRKYIDGNDWHAGPTAYEATEPGYLQGCINADRYIEAHLLNKRLQPRDLELLHFELIGHVGGTTESARYCRVINKSFLDDYCQYDTNAVLSHLLHHHIIDPYYLKIELAPIDLEEPMQTVEVQGDSCLQYFIDISRKCSVSLLAIGVKPNNSALLAVLEILASICPADKQARTKKALGAFLRPTFVPCMRVAKSIHYGLLPCHTITKAGLRQINELLRQTTWQMALTLEHTWDSVQFRSGAHSEDLTLLVQSILDDFYLALENATSRQDRLNAVITCCKQLVLLHPFYDGNSRLTYALLRLFLAQIEEPPTYFENPGSLAGMSNDELRKKIIAGQIKLQQQFGASGAELQNNPNMSPEFTMHYHETLRELSNWKAFWGLKTLEFWVDSTGPADKLATMLEHFGEFPEIVRLILDIIRRSPLFDLQPYISIGDTGGFVRLLTILNEGLITQTCMSENDQLLTDWLLHLDARSLAQLWPRHREGALPTHVFLRLRLYEQLYIKEPTKYPSLAYAVGCVEKLWDNRSFGSRIREAWPEATAT